MRDTAEIKRRLGRRAFVLGGLSGGAAILLAACSPRAPEPPARELTTSTPTLASATPVTADATAAAPSMTSPTPTAASPTGTPVAAPARTAASQSSATATGVQIVIPVAPEGGQIGSGPTRTPVPTATPVPPTATRAAAAAAPGTPLPTSTPRPTPPPRPTEGPRVPIEKITKWGLGVYREGNEIFTDLYVSKPTTLLLMDPSEAWARRVREWFPKAFIVGRLFRAEVAQPLDNPGARGAAFADTVAAHAVPLRGVVDAWMSYNEVVGHDAFDQYRLYNEFQVAFANRLQGEHGIDAVANNDGSGTVEPPDYPRYFADAIRACRYFGLHAYSPLGSHRMRDDAEWNCLRYRKIHDELENAGIRDKQFVITESGLGDGWLNRVDDVIMAEEFFWFTDELHRDPYVIGHAAYGLFGDGTWSAFDMRATDILTRMGYYEPPERRAAPPA